MSKFIPVNEDVAQRFVEKLSKTLFRDPEVFVQMFNAGLINRKNDEVVAISDELLTVFKGIERKADKITFLDQGEIAVEELLVKAEAYQVALQIQRIVKAAVSNRELTVEQEVYIDSKNSLILLENDSSISKERIIKLSDSGLKVLGRLIGVQDFGLETPVPAGAFAKVDPSPILRAAEALR